MDAEACRRAQRRFDAVYAAGLDAWSAVRLYPETREALREAVRLEPGLPGRMALDLGCGRGRMLAELRRAGFARSVGTDFSPAALAAARGRAANAAVADATRLPFRDGSFAAVTELTLLSSLEPVLWADVAAEIARVLAPRGFYLTEQVRRPPGWELERVVETACKLPRTVDAVWGFAPGDFERLLARDFDQLALREVPVRDLATDTPSWAGLFRLRW